MRVRLVRKLADQLNGVDVSGRNVGDILELSRREAELLVAEGWAQAEGADDEARRDVDGRSVRRLHRGTRMTDRAD